MNGFSALSTGDLFVVKTDAAAALGFFVTATGASRFTSREPTDTTFVINCAPSQTGDVLRVVFARDGAGLTTGRVRIDPTGDALWGLATATASLRNVAAITPDWLDNTDASRKGRLSLKAIEFGGDPDVSSGLGGRHEPACRAPRGRDAPAGRRR